MVSPSSCPLSPGLEFLKLNQLRLQQLPRLAPSPSASGRGGESNEGEVTHMPAAFGLSLFFSNTFLSFKQPHSIVSQQSCGLGLKLWRLRVCFFSFLLRRHGLNSLTMSTKLASTPRRPACMPPPPQCRDFSTSTGHKHKSLGFL